MSKKSGGCEEINKQQRVNGVSKAPRCCFDCPTLSQPSDMIIIVIVILLFLVGCTCFFSLVLKMGKNAPYLIFIFTGWIHDNDEVIISKKKQVNFHFITSCDIFQNFWSFPKIPATYISTSVIESQYIEIFYHIAQKLPHSFSIQQSIIAVWEN